ncbi:putative F-box protein [Cardamine amara subsp. amara]|uniref:F-box protein n=1 Tax=Cardamine amara subsp. amara TaxID=228776 RepID=A0ABD0ZLL6_CARAN
MFLLGYDPVEGKHKVLYLSTRDSEQPQVLTLGAQESWITIPKGRSPSHGASIGIDWGRIYPTRCVNDFIYYETYYGDGGGKSRLVSFDVRYEKFNSIKHLFITRVLIG